MSNNVFPDPMNVNVVSPDPLPTDPVAKDYFIELALGNIEGSTGSGKVAFSGVSTNATYSPIWGGANPMVFPTAVETWEIVSDSANDSLGGTGAETVLVNYLDFDYVQQSAVVDLNGLTPVQVATDCYRPDNMVVISSGSLKHNEGLVTLQDSGGGNPRGFMMPTIANSQDTYTTVPAGKRAILIKVSPYLAKDDAGNLKGLVELFGTNTIVTSGVFPVYQNTYDVGFEVPFVVPEKTDFWWEFKGESTEAIPVNLVTEFIFKDDT